MQEPIGYVWEAVEHIRVLAEEVGGRGSCTAAEQQAAEYAAGQLLAVGGEQVRVETHRGAPSTYRPYALAFAVALLGSALAWLVPLLPDGGGRLMLAAAAVLNGMGAGGMLAETDLAGNWLRRVLPRAVGHNCVGIVGPGGEVRRRAVLCAHLDSHRTPIFYSSRTWYALFSLLVGAAVASMALAAVVYGVGAAAGWAWVRWVGLAAAGVQVLALALCLHADRTPFSPGANDNATGVGTILAVAHRLAAEPLAHTEVWLAFTDCEEVGAYGMAAFLDAHAAELGPEAVYVILDQVGVGRVRYLTADGLIRKHKTHPRAVELAGRASGLLPELQVRTQIGLAYTDALVATKRGLVALTIDTLPAPGAGDAIHWHRMSDVVARVEPQALQDVHRFTWQVLQLIDRS